MYDSQITFEQAKTSWGARTRDGNLLLLKVGEQHTYKTTPGYAANCVKMEKAP